MNRSYHNENAFIELYNQYADDLFRFCMFRLRDRERALDATQDVFFKLWNEYTKKGDSFFEIENIRAFIFRIARNTVIDSTRKKTTTPFSFLTKTDDDITSSVEPVSFSDTTVTLEQRYAFSELLEHLELLDSHHREILVYKFLHDMTIPDIASILGISENATSVRIHRALEHARKKLAYLYE